MVTPEEWAIANEIVGRLKQADDVRAQAQIVDEYHTNAITLGDSQCFFLTRYRSVAISSGCLEVGVTGLTHCFLNIQDDLYALGLEDEDALLGRGQFGRVLRCVNQMGEKVAIKMIKARSYHHNEGRSLAKMGYCLQQATVGKNHYIVTPAFQGHDLESLPKDPNPWIAAAIDFDFDLQKLETAKAQANDNFENFREESLQPHLARSLGITTFSFSRYLDYVKRIGNKPFYSQIERYRLAIAAAEELARTFDNDILHRDIKGANFIGHIDQHHKAKVHLIDYGLSIPLSLANTARGRYGTVEYMGPQVLKATPEHLRHKIKAHLQHRLKPFARAEYGCASDIFSFSIFCQLDLGLSQDAGFGVLDKALSDQQSDRPTITQIIQALRLDVKLQQLSEEDDIKAFVTYCIDELGLDEDVGFGVLQSPPKGATLTKYAITTALTLDFSLQYATKLSKRIEIYQQFSCDLDNLDDNIRYIIQGRLDQELNHITMMLKRNHSMQYSQSLNFFKKTGLSEEMTLEEIITHAKGLSPESSGIRTRALLQQQGYMNEGNQLTGDLKALLDLQHSLESTPPSSLSL